MMESIEKLRELCAKWRKTSITPGRNSAADEVDAIADEIEREIAERFMELPVDADGVPIHVGDVVAAQDEQPFEVRAFQLDVLGWFAIERLGSQWNVNQLHHVKPRTIEDVLKEFGDWYKHVAGGCDEPGIIDKYADELRGMGVSE